MVAKLSLSWWQAIGRLAMANSIHWYVHLLKEDGNVLRRALDVNFEGQWRKMRQMMTWKKQFDKESVEVGLRMEDAFLCSKCSVGVNQTDARWRLKRPPSLVGDTA